MVFKVINADTKLLSKRLSLFGKSFADIKTDLKNGFKGAQAFGNVVTKQDITNLSNFNNALQNGSTRTQAWKSYIQDSTTTVKHQAKELVNLNNQLKSLNQQRATGKITEEQYNTQLKATQTAISTITEKTKSMTLANKLSTIGVKALGVAMNAVVNVAIGFAINSIISLFTHLANNAEDAKEKINDLSDSLRETIDELDEVNSKLEDNAKEIEEINKKPLDITNKEALERLTLENEQLKQQKQFLEEIAAIKKRDLQEETERYLNSGDWSREYSKVAATKAMLDGDWQKYIVDSHMPIVSGIMTFFDENRNGWEKTRDVLMALIPGLGVLDFWADSSDSFLDAVEKELEEVKELKEKSSQIDISTEKGNKEFKKLQDEISGKEKTLADHFDELDGYLDKLDPNSEAYKKIVDLILKPK